MMAKDKVKITKKVKVDISLIKMLKALDNQIRLTIVEHILNTSPVSRTYIQKLVEEVRGKTSSGFLSYHLDILVQTAVLVQDEHSLYYVPPETVRTLESLGLIETKDKYSMIYCVNYGNTFDDEKFFLNSEGASECAEADRLRHGLGPEDQLLGVKAVKVWKQYNPKKHGHEEKESAEK